VHILRQYFDLLDSDDVKTIQQKVAGKLVELDGDTNTIGVPIVALLRALPSRHRFGSQPVNERRQRVYTALMWLAGRMTADRPLVVAYEDLQWVTSDTRDFLEAYVRQVTRSTLCVLTYRSDYDASWLGDVERVELRLDGLSAEATRKIITDLLGSDTSLGILKDELPRRSGGNPLFIEEYVRNMVEGGERPARRAIEWARRSEGHPAPVRAVLAARIDRLSRMDKRVLQPSPSSAKSRRRTARHVCNIDRGNRRAPPEMGPAGRAHRQSATLMNSLRSAGGRLRYAAAQAARAATGSWRRCRQPQFDVPAARGVGMGRRSRICRPAVLPPHVGRPRSHRIRACVDVLKHLPATGNR
jgi:hypothetical protein